MKMTFEITFEMEEEEYNSKNFDMRPVYNSSEMRDFFKGALRHNPNAYDPTRRMTDLKVVHKRGKNNV